MALHRRRHCGHRIVVHGIECQRIVVEDERWTEEREAIGVVEEEQVLDYCRGKPSLTCPPKAPFSRDTVCLTCRHRLAHQSIRNAATAAAVADNSSAPAPPPPRQTTPRPNPPVTAKGPKKAYRLSASPVLSRPPLITRDLTSFEKAYYLYQKRLNERLALPFGRYFYYKKGTPGDEEWKRKIKARQTPAKDIGVYNAYGDEKWNDEVLVGDKLAERESVVEALIRDAEGKSIIEDERVGDADKDGRAVTGDARAGEGPRKELSKVTVERPAPRITEADRKGDLRSLSRKMDRTLYLVVRGQDGRWKFPEDRIHGRENLHQVST